MHYLDARDAENARLREELAAAKKSVKERDGWINRSGVGLIEAKENAEIWSKDLEGMRDEWKEKAVLLAGKNATLRAKLAAMEKVVEAAKEVRAGLTVNTESNKVLIRGPEHQEILGRISQLIFAVDALATHSPRPTEGKPCQDCTGPGVKMCHENKCPEHCECYPPEPKPADTAYHDSECQGKQCSCSLSEPGEKKGEGA